MVYMITDNTDYVKIGVAQFIEPRIASLQIGNPRELSLLKTIFFDSKTIDYMAEKAFHARYDKFRISFKNKRTEWFELNGVKDLLHADKHGISSILRDQHVFVQPNHILLKDPETIRTSILELKELLDSWTISALMGEGIRTVEGLENWVKNCNYKIKGIGDKKETNIKKALKEYKSKQISN